MPLRDRRSVFLAALLNGLIVLSLPQLTLALLTPTHVSVTVHPPVWSPARSALRAFARTALPMLPLAAVAAWRTALHARRWRHGERDMVAVAEAIACGAATALIVTLATAPGAPSLPAALPGILVVGAFGAVVGGAVGLLLYITAVVVLAVTGMP